MIKRNKSYVRPYVGRRSKLHPLVLVVLCLLALGAAAFAAKIVWDRRAAQVPEESPEATVPDFYILPSETAAPEPTDTTELTLTTEEGTAVTPAPSDFPVRGLYVTAWSAGIKERVDQLIELCHTTEVNALVIDVKDDRGQITYLTDSEELTGACSSIIPDMAGTVARLKENGIYSIARIVCFKDPLWSRTHPDLAIRTKAGSVWKDNGGNAWLDPYNPQSWTYLAAVAREAVRAGFDEIQLDYIRFPTDGKLSDIDYGDAAENKAKAEAIRDFLVYMQETLAEDGIKISADVFGIVILNQGDVEKIGQDFEMILQNTDVMCPMIYPSHYANKRQNGVGQEINGRLFETPDTEPYEVVYNTLLMAARRIPSGAKHAVIRPYLQDFTASYLGAGQYRVYTAAEVSEQIRAVYDAGFEEWILWNASGVYSEDALTSE